MFSKPTVAEFNKLVITNRQNIFFSAKRNLDKLFVRRQLLCAAIFLLASGASDWSCRAMLVKLAQSTIFVEPGTHASGILASLIIVPAAISTFAGAILTSRFGNFKVLFWASIASCLGLSIFLAGTNFRETRVFQTMGLSCFLSACLGLTIVPRINILLRLRRLPLLLPLALAALALSSLASDCLTQANVSAVQLAKWVLFAQALSAYSWRSIRSLGLEPTNKTNHHIRYQGSFSTGISLFVSRYAFFVFWLALTIICLENYQGEPTFAASALLALNTGVCFSVGLACAGFTGFIGLRPVLVRLLLCVTFAVLPVAFAFWGKAGQVHLFIFAYSALGAFLPLLPPKMSRPCFAPLSIAWGCVLLLTCSLGLCLVLEPLLDAISGSAQTRLAGVATAVIYLMAVVAAIAFRFSPFKAGPPFREIL